MRSAWADEADEAATPAHHGAPQQPKGKPGKPITVKLARDPQGHYDGGSILSTTLEGWSTTVQGCVGAGRDE